MEFIVLPTEIDERADGCVVNGACGAHACGINGNSPCANNYLAL